MRKLFLTGLILAGFNLSEGQNNRQLLSLCNYISSNRIRGEDSSILQVNYRPGGTLNYLYPLYQLFGEGDIFRRLLPLPDYYDQVSQALSFVGDYESAMEYQKKNYDSSIDESERLIGRTVAGLKNIQHVDAKKYIAFASRNVQIIMINEAHNKPQHRAFTMSLLEELHKRGFRYLAMEMLNNFPNHALDKLTPMTGHFATEPVAGELIRTALDIGYLLVSYEDTAADRHTPSQRDSIQAANIYKILRADPGAKILVHAGYGHIAEKNIGESYIPMGMAFKKLSGIDPLTIDQVDMTEESDIAYGKMFYDNYIQKYPLNFPSIALVDDQPINVTNDSLYDLSVIHPRTVYRDGRPIWLTLDGRRQGLYIKPANKNTFLVQAYYQFESFGNKPGQLVPADQTYIPTGKGNYILYLKRGKYIVVFRDMGYRILNTQHIEVS